MLKCRKNFSDGKSAKIMRYLPDKKKQKNGSLSNCRYCADRAKNLPGPAANIWLTLFHNSTFHPKRFIFGGVIAECPIEYFHDRLFEPIIRRLYCVEWTQYSIHPKRSAICNRGFPSRSLMNFMQGSLRDRRTDRPTDHATWSFAIGGIYLRSTTM